MQSVTIPDRLAVADLQRKKKACDPGQAMLVGGRSASRDAWLADSEAYDDCQFDTTETDPSAIDGLRSSEGNRDAAIGWSVYSTS